MSKSREVILKFVSSEIEETGEFSGQFGFLGFTIPLVITAVGGFVGVADKFTGLDQWVVPSLGVLTAVLTSINRALDPTAKQERHRLRKRALEFLKVEAGRLNEDGTRPKGAFLEGHQIEHYAYLSKTDPEAVVGMIMENRSPSQ